MVGINFTVLQAGVISLTLLYSAFIAEIYRAALLSIHRGQREAGLALGMRPERVFLRVVLPQATKIAIPNLGSMVIGMIKDTSTFVLIGAVEIIFRTNNLESTYFDPFVLYTAAAGVYVLVVVRRRLHLPHDREDADRATERRARGRLRTPPPAPDRHCHLTPGGRPRGDLTHASISSAPPSPDRGSAMGTIKRRGRNEEHHEMAATHARRRSRRTRADHGVRRWRVGEPAAASRPRLISD